MNHASCYLDLMDKYCCVRLSGSGLSTAIFCSLKAFAAPDNFTNWMYKYLSVSNTGTIFDHISLGFVYRWSIKSFRLIWECLEIFTKGIQTGCHAYRLHLAWDPPMIVQCSRCTLIRIVGINNLHLVVRWEGKRKNGRIFNWCRLFISNMK